MELKEMGEIVRDFIQTAEGKKVTAQRATAKLAERKAWVQELQRLDAQAAREQPVLDAAVEEQRTQLLAAWAAYREAQAQHGQALSNSLGISTRFSQERAVLEAKLRETASPEIDAALDTLNANLHAMRTRGPEAHVIDTGEYDYVHGRPQTMLLSNHTELRAGIEAVREAIAQAERLKLEALTPEAVAARLTAITNGVREAEPR